MGDIKKKQKILNSTMNKILTIVVPVYNEINTIDIIISRLKN